MARRPTIEEQLSHLRALRDEPNPEVVRQSLTRALRSRSSLLVAEAARATAEQGLVDLVEELEKALERLLDRPAQADKGCTAKSALVRTLLELEAPAGEIFKRGAYHVQPEPAFGGPVDAAVELRSLCVRGLLQIQHPEAMLVATDALMDKEWPVRRETARALVLTGRLEVESLLRLKALSGDPEPEVVGQCLASLLRLFPNRSLPFVHRFLQGSSRGVIEVAALALGESRLEEAVDLLLTALREAPNPDLRRTFLLALATTRREQALDFLLGRVLSASTVEAHEALSALSVNRHDEALRQRVLTGVTRRGEEAVRLRFEREFALD